MALNIQTDKKFDEALEWVAKKESKTKSDVIRDLVFRYFEHKRKGFQFGALCTSLQKPLTSKQIQEELENLDNDHDLD